jgi:hypothetical protein
MLNSVAECADREFGTVKIPIIEGSSEVSIEITYWTLRKI